MDEPADTQAEQKPVRLVVRDTERSQSLLGVSHLLVVVCVVFAAVGLRLDRAIDIPTTSSVLIGALGYATGLTAGRSRGNGN